MTRWIRMIAALAATLIAPTAQAENLTFLEFHGTWIVQDAPLSSASKCTMIQIGSATNVTTEFVPYNVLEPPLLTGYIDQTGKFQLMFTINGLYSKYRDRSNTPFEVKIDGEDVPLTDTYSRDMDTILLTGASTRTFRDIMEPSLEGGSGTIVVTGFGIGVKFPAQGSKAAIDALRRCEGKAAPALASMDGPDSEDEETGANEGVDDALGSAMRGMTSQQPPILQLRCSISGEAMLGLPNMGYPSRTGPTIATVSVAEDGTASINGTAVEPQQVQRATDGSSRLLATAFAMQDVMSAANPALKSMPSLGTFSAEENAALQAIPGILNGMMGQVMGDRRRFMLVSIDASSVVFFDLDAQNQAVNRSEAECVRTM